MKPVPLTHLRALTGRFGIHQHAAGDKPDPAHGFCTDDNARILIFLTDRERLPGNIEDFTRERTPYFDFLLRAFNPETGRFRNFTDDDGRWLEQQGSEDSHGRALWALGHFVGFGRGPGRDEAEKTFAQALPAVQTFTSPRSWVFTLMALWACRDTAAFTRTAASLQSELAGRLEHLFSLVADDEWRWLENCVTYDNGKICEAMIKTGQHTGNGRWMEIGLQSLEFLLRAQTAPEGHFRAIGSEGFWQRGGAPAQFDQQPLEAQAMTSACLAAFQATGETRWHQEARRVHQWFLGGNDLGIPVAVPETGGCHDGLGRYSVNLNQGAESTWAWLQSTVDLALAEAFPPAGASAESSASKRLVFSAQ